MKVQNDVFIESATYIAHFLKKSSQIGAN